MRRKVRKLSSHLRLRHRRAVRHVNRRPALFVPLITFGVLFVACALLLVFVNRGNPLPALKSTDSRIVIVTTDEGERIVPTHAKTVGELLERLDITMHQGDVVEPARDAEIFTDNYRVNVYRAKPVTIVDGQTPRHVMSAATTPRSISRQAELTVYPEDVFDARPPANFVSSGSIGQVVTIKRSLPVKLSLYGQQIDTRTQAKTVGDLLKEKGIKLQEGETVQPEVTAPLEPNTIVFVNNKGTRVETTTEEIPYATETVEDASLSFGTSAVRQQGVPGTRVVTYQINTDTGQRTKFQEIVLSEPVTHIVARGKTINIPSDKQGVMAAAGIRSSDYAYVNHIVSKESGWNAAAYNARSGATGLCQALPGSKMASAGSDWKTNPVTQLKWCQGYAVGRYGSWGAAYDFWNRNHWW